MRLRHTHETAGPCPVAIYAPELPVRITIDPDIEYAMVDVLADRGQEVWAGSIGPEHKTLAVEAGRPTLKSFLRGKLGLRSGSYISGGGSVTSGGRGSIVSGGGGSVSVRATGRGSIASGGNIENVATGDNARIYGLKKDPLPEIGVNLTVPPQCMFRIKAAQSTVVLYNGAEMSLEYARQQGWVGVTPR